MDPNGAFDDVDQTLVLQDHQQYQRNEEDSEVERLEASLAPGLGESHQTLLVRQGTGPISELPYMASLPLGPAAPPVEESSMYEPIPLEQATGSQDDGSYVRLQSQNHLYSQLLLSTSSPTYLTTSSLFSTENTSILYTQASYELQTRLPLSTPPTPPPRNLQQPPSVSEHAPRIQGDRGWGVVGTEKEWFFLFVKILLKCLDRSGDPRGLKEVARTTILECTRRNREGDRTYAPLREVLVRRLHAEVGEPHWSRAARLCRRYLERRRGSAAVAV